MFYVWPTCKLGAEYEKKNNYYSQCKLGCIRGTRAKTS